MSEDPTVSVLVLEKGPLADTWASRVPLFSANPTGKDFLGVKWTSVPQKNVDNRSLLVVRGEALGGTSRVNGALYTRGLFLRLRQPSHPQSVDGPVGTPGDYNRWEELGNIGWGYRDLEPYFIKSERTQTHSASQWRAKEGKDVIHVATWLRCSVFQVYGRTDRLLTPIV